VATTWRPGRRRELGDATTPARIGSSEAWNGPHSRRQTYKGVPVPHSATIAELEALISARDPRRGAAFVALGYSADSLAAWILLRATSSPDWELRRAACEALGLRVRGPSVVERIGELLKDRIPSVVRSACTVIGAFGDRAYRDDIIGLLDDRDDGTRHTAVVALGKLWLPVDSARLLRLTRADPSRLVSSAAAAVLLRHVDDSIWHRLFEAWIDHPVARNRGNACRLAVRFGDPSVTDRVAALRLDRDPIVRGAAETALGRLRNPSPTERVDAPSERDTIRGLPPPNSIRARTFVRS
jgi:HEAT repeat protein